MTEALFASFSNSVGRLEQALNHPKSVLVRDSAIKRFELTFELAWKSAKALLRENGITCQSPRDCIAQCFQLGIIQDDPLWVRMIEDRHLSVHTYIEQLADAIYGRLKDYLELFKTLTKSLTQK